MAKHKRFSREFVLDLYVAQGLPAGQIGQLLGVSSSAVHRWLKKYGVQPRPQGTPSTITRDVLEELCLRRGLTAKEAAKVLGVGRSTVGNRLKVLGIRARTSSPAEKRLSDGILFGVPPHGCWEWQKTLISSGYGHIGVGGKLILTHRLAYEWLVGPIPEDLELDHKVCNNRKCCNPAHLEPVTHKVNMERAGALITHCPAHHPYDEQNTIITTNGSRRCRKCKNNKMRAAYHRQRDKTRAA